MTISILGYEFSGLTEASFYAELGNKVIYVEHEIAGLEALRKKEYLIDQKILSDSFYSNLDLGNIVLENDLREGVSDSNIVIFTYPENYGSWNDLEFKLDMYETLSKYTKGHTIIIDKYNIPFENLVKVNKHLENFPDIDLVSTLNIFYTQSSEENYLNPERIIIGANSQKSKDVFDELFASYKDKGVHLSFVENTSAEIIKHLSNVVDYATRYFFKEISQYCKLFGEEFEQIFLELKLKSLNSKINTYPNQADELNFFSGIDKLIKSAEANGYELEAFKSISALYGNKFNSVIPKLKKHFSDHKLQIKKIAVWGSILDSNNLTTPIIKILISDLLRLGILVKVYDPLDTSEMAHYNKGKLKYYNSKYEALENVDALIILNNCTEFNKIDFELIKFNMKNKVILDCRDFPLLDFKKLNEFDYLQL
jgi:UDPglucose 6-dehydrogenase